MPDEPKTAVATKPSAPPTPAKETKAELATREKTVTYHGVAQNRQLIIRPSPEKKWDRNDKGEPVLVETGNKLEGLFDLYDPEALDTNGQPILRVEHCRKWVPNEIQKIGLERGELVPNAEKAGFFSE